MNENNSRQQITNRSNHPSFESEKQKNFDPDSLQLAISTTN